MSQVNNDPAASNILSHLNIDKKNDQGEKDNELGQTAFLELMITQMNNQDPLSPQDNTEFISQLAQFSSVEGMERLNSNFEGFTENFRSNQALQASSLVGTSVTVPAKSTELTQGGIISGSAQVDSATSDLKINVYDESGSMVDQVSVGSQEPGELVFRWDGQRVEVNGELLEGTAAEEPLPPGEYRFEVTATQDGEATELDTALSANVNSVTMGEDGQLTLNLAGVGAVNISQVQQFN